MCPTISNCCDNAPAGHFIWVHPSPLPRIDCGQGGIFLRKARPIFYSAMMLTGVNLLLRFVGTSFQVYLSRRIGAAGIGLLQLTLSVGNLAMVAGMGGIRTATMYLTAGELGRRQPRNVTRVLSACFLYSILFSGTVGLGLYVGAPWLAGHWIGNPGTVGALRLYGAFLPVVCLCGVMSGYFTAAKRIGTLAMVEIAEQLCSMVSTMTLLTLWAGEDAERACLCVVFGTSLGACLTLALLLALRVLEKPEPGAPFPIRKRLLSAALPLALADVVRSGISTTENLMVPKRLKRFPGEADPLAAFGRVSGMVFPVMMFPACILFALAELLIPELAGCAAAGSERRIRYLSRRGLWAAMLYGVFFGGLIFLLAEPLCLALYGSAEAGRSLRFYALMVPFLYCDAITDAMTKGLGQQKVCVRYNILTSSMDVALLYVLLPRFGMEGYYWSFLVTHLLNFLLSLHRLQRITHVKIPFHTPVLAFCAAVIAAWGAEWLGLTWLYIPLMGALLALFGVVRPEDGRWLLGLVRRRHIRQPAKAGGFS